MRRFNRKFAIAGREVGEGCPVYIVAEAGVAHGGMIEKAYKLVDIAVAAGADAVKFQIFTPKDLFSGEAAEWRARMGTATLPHAAFTEIKTYAERKGITFFATAHDEPSLSFLDQLDIPVYKVASSEVDNWPFLGRIGAKKKPVILSTGMYTMEKIGRALDVLAVAGAKNVCVLHCINRYPTPPEEVNLRAMAEIGRRFGVATGYSDRTESIHIPLAAVALGARIIQKHISLDFNVPNALEWKVSCDGGAFSQLVRHAREIEAGMGTGTLARSDAELANLARERKSLATAVPVREGEVLTADKIVAKRPGTGIAPGAISAIVGRRMRRALPADAILHWEDLA